MSTKREQIVAAVCTQVATVSGLTTHRSRTQALQRASFPAAVVQWISDNPQSVVIPKIDWSMILRVTVIARGAIADQVADPYVQAVHSKLTADLSLGGLCMDIQPAGVQNNLEDADQDHCEITMDFVMVYRTLVADLTQ